MGCSPIRRGHEVCALSPFIENYNRINNARYAFERVLDASGSTPQPEALYVDAVTQGRLVVEHKTFIWPSDHFQLHKSCHEVAERIEGIITPVLDPGRAYRLELPDDLRGSRPDLRAFADVVGAAVRDRLSTIHDGTVLRSRRPGREWRFCEESEFEREYFQPSKGLIIEFSGSWRALPPPDHASDQAAILADLLNRASDKFRTHADARRLLVLDPHGDLRFTPDDEWARLLSFVAVPANVDEVWISYHDLITDIVCGWMHQPVWPTVGEERTVGCVPFAVTSEEAHSSDTESVLGRPLTGR